MPNTRVIGLGQSLAGDDAAGIRVVQELESRDVQADLCTARDVSELVDLLNRVDRAIIVDAFIATEAGSVLELEPDRLAGRRSLSSHGLDVAGALELANSVLDDPCPRVEIVGIGIERPTILTPGLSRPVERAVLRAAALIAAKLQRQHA